MSPELAHEHRRRDDLPLELAEERESLKVTGIWMFLVTDVMVFASLFASYAVFEGNVAAGPTPGQLFHLGPVLVETLALLSSSFAMGLAVHEMRNGRVRAVAAWMLVTMILGALFVGLEVREFAAYAVAGDIWHRSAFLSGLQLLVGTHGAHVTFGIVWAATIVVQLLRRGLTSVTARKVYTFALYWHFLDIVWVFIFTVVYLAGKVG